MIEASQHFSHFLRLSFPVCFFSIFTDRTREANQKGTGTSIEFSFVFLPLVGKKIRNIKIGKGRAKNLGQN